MIVELAAVASAACLFVLAMALWVASRHVRLREALRDAARAEFGVGCGLLVRVWAPDSEYGALLVLATLAYAAHGVWIHMAMRRLRGWDPAPGWHAAVMVAAVTTVGAGLWWPGAAYAGLGLCYLLMAGVYAAVLVPALRGTTGHEKAPLALLGVCGALCTVMYVAWGGAMIAAPDLVRAEGRGAPLAASFLFGLWLNLVATGCYLMLVLRQLLGEIEALAVTDPLTGARNRRALASYEQQRTAAASGAAPAPARARGLIAIDIDHFKQINDTRGHTVGDEVLAACASRLRAQMRAWDTLVRMGGEEFLVILEGADRDVTQAVAERMRAAVAGDPVPVSDGAAVAITISLGTADGTGVDLVADARRADRALYRAKREGRNRVVADAGTDEAHSPPAGATATPA